MTALRAAAESHTGYVRSNNQDTALVSGDLVAVADGMGGHLGGEVAARTAIEELLDAYRRDRSGAGLAAAVRRANQAIWRKSRVDRKLHGMGTTLTAVALVEGDGAGSAAHLALVNVGDSRAYAVDTAGHMKRLTEDHSVVEEMVRQGELTPAEAAVHPHRHVLTRALGIEAEVELDIWDLEPVVGTRILLCSDGLTNEVPEDEIAEVLHAAADPEEAARELVGRALGHGGMDNVTVVVIDVADGDAASLDQPAEIVPPRPATPESGEIPSGGDITQAVPIVGAGGAVLAAAEDVEEAERAEQGEKAEQGAEAEETRAMPGGSAAAGGAGAAAAAAAAADGSTSEQPAVRRSGRSMRMSGPAPVPVNRDEPTSAHGRPMVLVPTKRLAKEYRDRIVTFRVFVFLLALAALLGGVIAFVIWFQQSSYYVGLAGQRVSIYKGRPGGMWWFKPSLVETSNITTKDLLPNTVQEVHNGITETSYRAAKVELSHLAREQTLLGLGGTATATTVTLPPITVPTTTAPPVTTPTSTAPPPTTAPPTTQPAPTTAPPSSAPPTT